MDFIPNNWQDWGALAIIVEAIAVCIALFYGKRELGEMARSRKLDATRKMLDEIGNHKIWENRDHIFNLKQINIDWENIKDDKELSRIRSVAVAYDRVGYMLKQDLIPEEALFKFQGDEIEQLWEKIGPTIERFREIKKRPNYCKDFQFLAVIWLPKMKRNC